MSNDMSPETMANIKREMRAADETHEAAKDKVALMSAYIDYLDKEVFEPMTTRRKRRRGLFLPPL